MVAGTRLAGAAAAVLAGAWPGAAGAAGAARPHVLLIVVDDLGWNNLGFKRERLEGPEQQEMLTPNIDRLVRSGIELNR
jgi:arylsulfatase A-like enzyme